MEHAASDTAESNKVDESEYEVDKNGGVVIAENDDNNSSDEDGHETESSANHTDNDAGSVQRVTRWWRGHSCEGRWRAA